MSNVSDVPHPGIRIRAEVIPDGMSVTKAAQLLGVGRPALSNLLNGNASLSEDMAKRLEKTFKKHPLKDLIAMQAEYDAAQASQKNTSSDTKAYVPPFLAIKANDIEAWVSHNIQARNRFAVFLRTLVHSTCSGLEMVDFPGNDDAERTGWDGLVVASEGMPWVPSGRSVWEFGTNEDPKAKADRDFAKSLKGPGKKQREETTFVFVTPRRWAGKTPWVNAKKATRQWKDVRAYDASDLEQWLEQSLPAQAWFANETHKPAHDVRSLDKCWADWANVTTPPLTGSLFNLAIEATKRTMLSQLSKPSDGPIVISADSTEEALAFLAQLFSDRGGQELSVYRDRVLVFDKPGVLSRLAQGAMTFIPVVFTRDVERELAPFAKSLQSIIIYPRNCAGIDPHVVLESADYETFNKAIEEMGKDRDEINRLANESGRSLTVLRRRMATVHAVRTPAWAADPKIAMSLVPFFFIGAWQSTNMADSLGLSMLAYDRSYDELERDIQGLVQLDDAPVWSIGSYRGVISKIDLLYAISSVITTKDLRNFFTFARIVMGEDDPSLDLMEDQRWVASLHGKTREFSGAFRKGVSETLVLLAVHGGHLFNSRLGISIEEEVQLVVRELLPTPLTTRILEANEHDLPTYAEAAPREFLSIIERDLQSEAPVVLDLMRPVDSSVFGLSPSRTGLLWALESLAWNPETLPRVVLILARLAQVEINDNWINKPMHSLQSIFRAWMPQTSASLADRVGLMNKLAKRFPDVAWKICMSQFGNYHETGDYSHKPRWRPDGFGFGEPIRSLGPIMEFKREMVELALAWKDHKVETLVDLVERLHSLDEGYRLRVWELIEAWANAKATDAEKAAMREKIRLAVLSKRAARYAKKSADFAKVIVKAKATLKALEPTDLINKHAWLFRNNRVEESADENDENENIDEFDFQGREKRIEKLRIDAIRQIRDQCGLPALLELAQRGKAAWLIGFYTARDILSEASAVELLRLALNSIKNGTDGLALMEVIGGALRAISEANESTFENVLKAIGAGLPEEDMVLLLVLAPFGKCTWRLVDAQSKEAQAKYWSDDRLPGWIRDSDVEINEGVERLLSAGRPRAAFSCAQFYLDKFDAQVIFRLLTAVAVGGNEKSDEHMLEKYYIEQAFKQLDASSLLTVEQKAGLEFAFLDFLAWSSDHSADGYGIPNIERYIESNPRVFVQAITWAYKRKDGGTDPIEFQAPKDSLKNLAARRYKLLGSLQRIPGHDRRGELQANLLLNWVAAVRKDSDELGRADVADFCIGRLLANAPVGKDGVWPCETVREVMEEIQSESIMRGAHNGVYNSRGVHFRPEGGDPERELAAGYRNWGQSLQFSHPYVASHLLEMLARTYEQEAEREDLEAGIRRRLE